PRSHLPGRCDAVALAVGPTGAGQDEGREGGQGPPGHDPGQSSLRAGCLGTGLSCESSSLSLARDGSIGEGHVPDDPPRTLQGRARGHVLCLERHARPESRPAPCVASLDLPLTRDSTCSAWGTRSAMCRLPNISTAVDPGASNWPFVGDTE